jgi:hypothetical protein
MHDFEDDFQEGIKLLTVGANKEGFVEFYRPRRYVLGDNPNLDRKAVVR